MTLPNSDLEALDAEAIIELFEIDATAFSGPHLYFHAGTNELKQKVVWNSQTYDSWPIQVTGFAKRTKGTLPRPKIAISNINSLISAYLLAYDDLLGARVIRHRTMAKYLDAINFSGGNPTANPDEHMKDEIWYIYQKSGETNEVVELTLSSPMDLQGTVIPRRQIVQNYCSWKYKGAECGWTPVAGKYFDENNNSVTGVSKDECSHNLKGCQLRFGEHNPLPFGGFPAAGLIKR